MTAVNSGHGNLGWYRESGSLPCITLCQVLAQSYSPFLYFQF